MVQPQILLMIQRQARTNAQYRGITEGKITCRITEAVRNTITCYERKFTAYTGSFESSGT